MGIEKIPVGKTKTVNSNRYFLYHRKLLSYDIKNAPLRMRTRAIGKCCINATALGARMSQATFFVLF